MCQVVVVAVIRQLLQLFHHLQVTKYLITTIVQAVHPSTLIQHMHCPGDGVYLTPVDHQGQQTNGVEVQVRELQAQDPGNSMDTNTFYCIFSEFLICSIVIKLASTYFFIF